MFWRYFYTRAQAFFVLTLIGGTGAIAHPAFLLLCAPYIVLRASEPSATLKGPLRLLRPLLYVSRDAITFGMLTAASFRFRSLLL
jgi:hypothetical protein